MTIRNRFMIFTSILLLAASGMAIAGGADKQDTHGAGLEPVTLMLDWVANVNHVGIFVARDAGFFAGQGLDVRIMEPGEVYSASAVVGGQADFGIDVQENVTVLRSDGVPLVSIAAVLQNNTSGFAVRAGEGVDSPADFAGLTYGAFNMPFEQPTLASLVQCAGGDPDAIEFVTAGTDLLAMLDQGLADIIWIFYGTQGFQARQIGLEIDYFPLVDYTQCIPDYYTPVVIASETTLTERPDLTRKFLAALSDAHDYVVANPVESAGILADAVPELDRGELELSAPWLAGSMNSDAGWGHQELSVWEDYAEWMHGTGIFTAEFDATAAFTNDFLPRP